MQQGPAYACFFQLCAQHCSIQQVLERRIRFSAGVGQEVVGAAQEVSYPVHQFVGGLVGEGEQQQVFHEEVPLQNQADHQQPDGVGLARSGAGFYKKLPLEGQAIG